MSVLARRARDGELERHRALLAMRDSVVVATAALLPRSGSSATIEAVDDALEQLLDAGAHLGDLELVKSRWITWAQRRLIDTHRSAEFKRREAAPVDEHDKALAQGGRADPFAVGEDSRQWWRLQEILGSLTGSQREWADAWLPQVLSSSLGQGAQPRGLHDALGWTPAKTKKTAQRARRKMAAFIEDRSSGSVCTNRQALLDAFILATSADHQHRAGTKLDERRYEAVLLHVAGCEDCFAAWRSRRHALLARCGAVVMLPLDSVAAAAHAVTGKLAGLLSGAQNAAQSLLGRVGLGGGATAAAGGGAAAISSKTAAVCVGVVCAAGAGVGEITGVLPPIVPKDPPNPQRQEAVRKAAPAPVRPTVARPTVRSPAPPPPASTRPKTSSKATSTTSSSTKRTTTAARTTPRLPTRRSTPGDLPPASTSSTNSSSSSTSASTSSAPAPSAPTVTPTCTPGDLGC